MNDTSRVLTKRCIINGDDTREFNLRCGELPYSLGILVEIRHHLANHECKVLQSLY